MKILICSWYLIYICGFLLDSYSSYEVFSLSQIIKPSNSGDAVIRLKGFDKINSKLSFIITRLPIYGKLFQLSHSYRNYGYLPIAGSQIIYPFTTIIDDKNRIYYKTSYNRHDCSYPVSESFSFLVNNGIQQSFEANVTIVDKYDTIICSDFLLDNDKWSIVGNKKSNENAQFHPYSRDVYMNHYIYASESFINIDKYMDSDKSLWFFNAPSKFLGNKGNSYGGFIRFSIAIFAGDISQLNYGKKYNLIELECNQCGMTLLFPFISAFASMKLKNKIVIFEIPLFENKGWLKIFHNNNNIQNFNFIPPTKCEFIQVLSRLSALRILGDFTQWYETVAIDNIYITNAQNNIPRCAITRPDASICTC